MRIAVVSTDETTVDEHFGKADRFLIYDLEDGNLRKVSSRPVTPLSTGDANHPFDAGRFATVAEALEDCQKVYCTRIGEKPARELAARGIQAVPYKGAIADVPV